MAITRFHVQFLLSLKASIPEWNSAQSLMDIGEQNWFSPSFTFKNVISVARSLNLLIDAKTESELLSIEDGPQDPFAIAKLFYLHMLGITEYAAIDLHGTRFAQPWNLNLPYPPSRLFDLVFNLGTTEHIFNQFEVFNTIHKLCKPGGFMVHSLPQSGGREHGFFNYHGTVFYDLAVANGYAIRVFTWTGVVEKEGGRKRQTARSFTSQREFLSFIDDTPLSNEGLNVCFQKTTNAPFICPQQGHYDNSRLVDEERNKLWQKHR